jgi:hypothetical protein
MPFKVHEEVKNTNIGTGLSVTAAVIEHGKSAMAL